MKIAIYDAMGETHFFDEILLRMKKNYIFAH